MKPGESKSPEKIFADMHRELRAWNPQIPESAERLDPILRILLQLYAHQLSLIDKKIEMVWDVAANSLIRAVCPESMRWPVPAYTVMRCKPSDPTVEVDPRTRFFYREKREGGQTFFFSSLRKERLIAANVKYIFLKAGRSVLDLSPVAARSLMTSSRHQVGLPSGGNVKIYVAVDFKGYPAGLAGATLFLKGLPDVLKQLRWAHWYPGTQSGGFRQEAGFCPGAVDGLKEMFAMGDRTVDWGGLRSASDLFKAVEENFVVLSQKFTSSWQSGPLERTVAAEIAAAGLNASAERENLYWICLDLPPGGDKTKLQSPFEIHFGCFIAVNKNELTLFKHTGGNRLVEVELPEDISNILEVTGVVDSSGREYVARYMVQSDRTQKSYSLEERDNRLVLWFDFSEDLELPPDSITINYTVTAGTAANGIEAGKISELYESHPGILGSENIISTGGAIPSKTEQQIVREVSARLRSRDRAMSFAEISNWAMTFDPRVIGAECQNGIERAERGVRRCIVVRIRVKADSIYSDDEAFLLQRRLNSFLRSRSPVNTHFKIELVRE